MRRLNRRLLAWSAATTLALAGTCVGLHLVQSERIEQALFWQANEAERHGRTDQAVRLFRRYLQFSPADDAARARLGCILADRGPKASRRSREEALFLLEAVLLREPQRHDLRWIVIRLAGELHRPELALDHLHALNRALPADGETDLALGRWHESQARYPEAAEWYRRAVRHAPNLVEAYARLADVLRRHLEPTGREADQVMDELVSVNGGSFQAYLARWQYRRESGREEEAAADLARAAELAPDAIGVLLATAEVNQARGRLDQARERLEKGQRLFPTDERVSRARAHLEVAAGRRGEAIARLREALPNANPEVHAEVSWSLANLLIDENRIDEAETLIAGLPSSRFSATALDYLHGRLLMARERWAEAAERLERARPLDAQAYCVDLFLGYCYQRLNQPEREFSAYQRVTQRSPSSVAAWLGLAHAAGALGRHEEAQRHHRHAMTLRSPP